MNALRKSCSYWVRASGVSLAEPGPQPLANEMSNQLIVALSKGRILDETLPLLADAGITPIEDIRKSRKLLFDTNLPDVKFVVIRATDVPTYVQLGLPIWVSPVRTYYLSTVPKGSMSRSIWILRVAN